MKITQIMLFPITGEDGLPRRAAPKTIDKFAVWPFYGWYASLLLEEVTESDYAAIRNCIGATDFHILQFQPGREEYDKKLQQAFVRYHDRELIQPYIARGALDPDGIVAAQLAGRLQTLIRLMIAGE